MYSQYKYKKIDQYRKAQMDNAFSIEIQNIDQYREAQMHKAFSI